MDSPHRQDAERTKPKDEAERTATTHDDNCPKWTTDGDTVATHGDIRDKVLQ